ncbi:MULTISPECIES: 3'(2'),5'-bisphosphate nucleotidase CysQ [Idiomarina]|jgi:3'(2'), 5'-bisphosphate nucleotidase|uniref:3'(2'),5'-bisphosphate nucleotidase CysQ n=1 Tax=Idiomarina baltica OS145 TaxID=314276 RepID=A0ABP2CMJ0_9GAMM|nr:MULTISPECIES: 3'(2'),5'-bisphosphate nucleotidase CysQ [Idiomarina]EAQ30842.1 3'-Phosphoadenosine 5'-phosphosulfate (PAPS) 3'-phosphatase [Idiomarina baltica OS145]MEC8925477.1 3'(2'),5'-bisphosphate nucleotidase CysQ [Pseudomonadota bacterium]HAE90988.1 3'(2'),5'-bisphosphate nucleotidase [Idiomarina sp.]|tara:strand:+ start:256 stop:1011 length:756 start_codon:yes stop_codon:yes gene_type:complete
MFKRDVIRIAREAGAAIMRVKQEHSLQVSTKADESPVTQADLAAHHVIVDALRKLATTYPVISEECCDISWSQRKNWHRYWLVDPLDGTQEFIKGNDEFSVNIALIEQGVPILGVVYAPALDDLYYGERDVGAELNGQSITAVTRVPETLRVMISRSHPSEETLTWLEQLTVPYETIAVGSALKLCWIAAGKADLYPRLGPTSEWDIAAGQAVLLSAGGVVNKINGEPLRYNQKESFLNPSFIAKTRAYVI